MPLNKSLIRNMSNDEFCQMLDAQLTVKFPVRYDDARYLLQCCLDRLSNSNDSITQRHVINNSGRIKS